MVILIVLASNLPDQMASAQAHESGGQSNLVLAAPDNVPTLNPIQQLQPTESQPLLSIESPALTSVESQPFTSTESLALTSIESQSMPPSPAYSAVYLPITSMTIPPTPTPTPEPTPEPEVQEEIVFTSDEGRSWNDYPGPSIWPDMQAPAPVGILSHPEDQINILLLGSDQRPNDGGFRTDTIQLLTINPSAGTVKLTAFPRDLYVYIPGYTMQRINTAMGWGGFDALANTMEYNFGVRPEYYVLINFSSFKDAIDSIGGITVDVGKDFCDHRDDFGEFCVSQSSYWMNGKTA
jgi:LCP family protein required for cell wall assembly